MASHNYTDWLQGACCTSFEETKGTRLPPHAYWYLATVSIEYNQSRDFGIFNNEIQTNNCSVMGVSI